MDHPSVARIVRRAWELHTAVPGFNIPYLPMMLPVVRALRDTRCVGLISVARLEWTKFRAGGPAPVYETYSACGDVSVTRLHLDHVPVIDEDDLQVDYLAILGEAVDLGYDSIMVDGSRLSLEDNIAAAAGVTDMAHAKGVAVEAELGAILGHEKGPLPPYDELFESGRGFTQPGEARRFVTDTRVDWLSVAVGSFHGAITADRTKTKPAARLDLEHLARLNDTLGIPLVLHGGTGIPGEIIRQSMQHGIAKINVATAIRQPYEALVDRSPQGALEAVYEATCRVVRDDLGLEGTAETLMG